MKFNLFCDLIIKFKFYIKFVFNIFISNACCVFEGCMSGSKKKNLIKLKNVHLHKFPKNENSRKIKKFV